MRRVASVSRWVRRAMTIVAAGLLSSAAQAGGASPGASSWSQGFHSRVRLISGGEENGRLLAGIEIVLDKGFKTYWRTPGESGLPPRFDWTASANADAIEVRWPTPTRTEDAGGVAYGYGDRVVFPVLVTPADRTKPAKLNLGIEYGVCKEICIPAQASLDLTVSTDGSHNPAIGEALAAVPRPQPLGAAGPLSILSVEPVAGGGSAFAVEVRIPAGAKPSLFAEGPENWYLSTPAAIEPGNRFTVTIDERPKVESGPVALRFTLVAGDQAIETEVRLDADLQPR
jgi:DsbC/DsbD-like thiol-disulfide interchange protein